MEKEKIKAFSIIIFLVLFGSILLLIPDKAKRYHDNGIKVDVTITQKSGIRTKQYVGIYTDENGNQITAQVIPNQGGVFVGDRLIGYYMPDDSSKVICYNGSGLIIIMRIIGISLYGVGVFMIIRLFKADSENNDFY